MSDDVELRAPRLSDAEALTTMMNQPDVQAGTARVPFTSQAWVEARVGADDPRVHSVVAVVDETAVGWATLVRRTGRHAHCGNLSITVHDAFAGRGIGTRLMAALIDVADNWLGLERLVLEVYVENERAQALYQKFGFEIEGQLRQDSMRNGKLTDAYVMARLRKRP